MIRHVHACGSLGVHMGVRTLLAPALRTMPTIWLMVVPRTMESSTSRTFLPANTEGMAFSLRRTLSSRVLHRTAPQISARA